MSTSMIRFENITKSYSLQRRQQTSSLRGLFSRESASKTDAMAVVVNDVTFTINAGDSVALLGGNGAGKSTILKLLTRLTLPDSGNITVNGKLSCLLEVGAGFHHDLSGLENIALSGALLGMRPHEVSQVRQHIIDFSDIGSAIEQPVRTYSSGMLLRLAFSIGVYLYTDILAIDEALAVGDSSFQARCLSKINQLNQQGRTLVLVSHDMSQLRRICRSGLVMHQGQLIAHCDIEQAITLYDTLLRP